jgi:transglutaminase-like putative cysteine protease
MNRNNFFFHFFLIICFLSCREKPPVIRAIDPKIGAMGDIISVKGENFGKKQDDSYITIAGQEPTSSSYLEWSDSLIRARLPDFGETGLIFVHKGGQKSNAVIFSDRAKIPEQARDAAGRGVHIDAISPVSASIGSLISIQGGGFGATRDEGSVRFTWLAENALPDTETISIEPFDNGFGYELWSSDEIRVYAPDGAASGYLEVTPARGGSASALFTVIDKPGTKIFKEKRSWIISYSVNIRAREASVPNTLYLWVPQPAYSASQPKTELLSRDREPFVENYRGTNLFQLKDIEANSSISINLSYVVDVYAVETAIKPQSIKSRPALPAFYTQSTPLIPSDDAAIKKLSAEIIGNEKNPYLKAQKIYEWLIHNAHIQSTFLNIGVLDALEQKKADAYAGSLLFCALSRASGVPSIPVSGVLIVDQTTTAILHYWAEFWIDGFGWVPVDPALGANPPPFAPSDRNAAVWYFGNLDHQRIIFSRGQNQLSQMDPRGRIAARNPDYALQDFWEESVGGLESYSSLWSDITIMGMYTQ